MHESNHSLDLWAKLHRSNDSLRALSFGNRVTARGRERLSLVDRNFPKTGLSGGHQRRTDCNGR
jgi:S-adenosylmethionine:diacylglycerol 3-amino-3-carboxypropyl transferase